MKVTDFFTREQLEVYEKAVNVPTQGSIQDAEGIIHSVLGDYTYCDRLWYMNATIGRSGLVKGWGLPFKNGQPVSDAPVTCLECAAHG